MAYNKNSLGSTQSPKQTGKQSCCHWECSIPCLEQSEIAGGNDSNIIDILDITFVIISHLSKIVRKFDKKICFVARIWAGYVVDGVEVIIISVNAGGLNFHNWFAQVIFGAYVIAIISFAVSVSLMEFCCKVKISQYWMRILIVFKVTSFINAMFIFIHPLVIFDDDFEIYEILIMVIAAVDMILILMVCTIALLVYGKCIKLRKGGVRPIKSERNDIRRNSKLPVASDVRRNSRIPTSSEKKSVKVSFFEYCTCCKKTFICCKGKK